MNVIEMFWELGYKGISFNKGLYKVKLTYSKMN